MTAQPAPTITIDEHAVKLRELIIDEIIYAFSGKRSKITHRLVAPFLRTTAGHFGRIAAEFYEKVITLGVSEGARATLPRFNHTVTARGIERIPKQGPLLIVSNHPGGLDSLGIVSCIPRNDLKALVSDIKFMRVFDIQQRYCIYVSFEAIGGMVALRDAIDHLRSGGALLVFAHGDVEPEPEYLPGAREAIQEWSRSLEIMLHKVPETNLQIISTSGAVLHRFLNSPVTRLRKQPERRQKLAEFLQVIQSLLLPGSIPVNLHLTIGEPIATDKLGEGRWMPEIIRHAQAQLDEHLAWVNDLTRFNKRD
ncbi:MAG: hypothetical protein WBV22_06530 [Anaerolineaceae bacterium]